MLHRYIARFIETLILFVFIGVAAYVGIQVSAWMIHTYGVVAATVVGAVLLGLYLLAFWKEF